jgi:hypothetical protein
MVGMQNLRLDSVLARPCRTEPISSLRATADEGLDRRQVIPHDLVHQPRIAEAAAADDGNLSGCSEVSSAVHDLHSRRAAGVTPYLANGGVFEHVQEMAAHESSRTTKLFDRTKERLTQDEVERIRL